MSSMVLSHGVFKFEGQQLAGFRGEFTRQFAEYVLAKAANHCGDGVFAFDAALLEEEELVFRDAAGARFVFGRGAWICHRDIGKGMGRAVGAHDALQEGERMYGRPTRMFTGVPRA